MFISVPDQKNALLLLMIDLAVKIVAGETSVEKELADGMMILSILPHDIKIMTLNTCD